MRNYLREQSKKVEEEVNGFMKNLQNRVTVTNLQNLSLKMEPKSLKTLSDNSEQIQNPDP